jgi:hypothetical protein
MRTIVLILAAGLTLNPALADPVSDRALIAQALQREVDLEFNGTLSDALQTIGLRTGVAVRLSAEALDLLPAGPLTPVRGRFAAVPLEEAITVIARKLGLQVIRAEAYVELHPLPAVIRAGEPLTADELELLDLLQSSTLALPAGRPTYEQLVAAIDLRLAEIDQQRATAGRAALGLSLENRGRDLVAGEKIIALPARPSLYLALELLHEQTPLTWYPWDAGVVIVPKRDLHQRLLLKRINLNVQNLDAGALLDELSRRSGVRFRYDAGALASVRPDRRMISFAGSRTSVRSVLDVIQRQTGLTWSVDDDGVLIGYRDRIGMLLDLGNGISVPIPESQIPDELRAIIDQRIQRWLEDQRSSAVPTTQPDN